MRILATHRRLTYLYLGVFFVVLGNILCSATDASTGTAGSSYQQMITRPHDDEHHTTRPDVTPTQPRSRAAQCTISGGTGSEACTTPIVGTSVYNAGRSNPGNAVVPVDVWNTCRWIDNTTTATNPLSLFVPFNSKPEWDAFVAHHPASAINLAHCARQASLTILPSSACGSPSPATHPIGLPYARVGETQTKSVDFTCTIVYGSNPPQTWTQTAAATFTSLDSDLHSTLYALPDPRALDWTQVGVTTYVGAPPPPPTPPAVGCVANPTIDGVGYNGGVTYRDPGNYTLTVPAGVTTVDYKLRGGGEGGSGFVGAGQHTWIGGPAGSSGYFASGRQTVSPGDVLSIAVGAGGAGGDTPAYRYPRDSVGGDGGDTILSQAGTQIAKAAGAYAIFSSADVSFFTVTKNGAYRGGAPVSGTMTGGSGAGTAGDGYDAPSTSGGVGQNGFVGGMSTGFGGGGGGDLGNGGNAQSFTDRFGGFGGLGGGGGGSGTQGGNGGSGCATLSWFAASPPPPQPAYISARSCIPHPVNGMSYYTAGSSSFIVPTNVTKIYYKLRGGGGGGGGHLYGKTWYSGGSGGGSGWLADGSITVTPGQVLAINVGHGGSGGHSTARALGFDITTTSGSDGEQTQLIRAASPIAIASGGGGGNKTDAMLGGMGAFNGGNGGGITSGGVAGGGGGTAAASTSSNGGAGANGFSGSAITGGGGGGDFASSSDQSGGIGGGGGGGGDNGDGGNGGDGCATLFW